MQKGQNVEHRGGVRAGVGRKPGPKTTLGAQEVARLRRKVKKYTKLYGKDPDDVLMGFIYGASERTVDRLAAIKLLKEYTAPKITEGGEADKTLGPAVFLPEHRPPELSVIHGEKDGQKVA